MHGNVLKKKKQHTKTWTYLKITEEKYCTQIIADTFKYSYKTTEKWSSTA